MFAVEDWEAGFLWVENKEHPIVDIRYKKPGKFDVSIIHYPDYPPDFLKDGVFDHRQYCICLLRMTGELSRDGLEKLLERQCKLMKDPVEWLFKFGELLEIVDDYKPVLAYKTRFKWLEKFISEEIISRSSAGAEEYARQSSGSDAVEEPEVMYLLEKVLDAVDKTNSYREQISVCNKFRALYLRKVGSIGDSSLFVRAVDKILDARKVIVSKEQKKTVWEGTAKALVHHHVWNNIPRDNMGRFIVNPCHATEARRICDLYLNDKRKHFKFTTIQTAVGKEVREIKSKFHSKDEK